MLAPPDPLGTVLDYHERTRHLVGRYARSRGFLDWANQPDPFRTYPTAKRVLLDEVPPGEVPRGHVSPSEVPTTQGSDPARLPGLDAAWDPGRTTPRPMDRSSISQLLYDSLGLTAWKQVGDARWALRANPSSGNLHPTEGYLVCGPVYGLSETAFVAHYSPINHGLEILRTLSPDEHAALFAGLPASVLLVGLTSIHWRESWKYGERAYRYSELDVGHAIACLAAAASLLGWRLHVLAQVSDADLSVLVGVDCQSGPEAEHPGALLCLFPHDAPDVEGPLVASHPPDDLGRTLRKRPHCHVPAPLSSDHHPWSVIDTVAAATHKGREAPEARKIDSEPVPLPSRSADPPARQLIRQRRSAQDMDGETELGATDFFRLLAALLPAPRHQPHAALPWRPAVHPVFFVHRVQGLSPGFYALPRHPDAERDLRTSLLTDFAWERPAQAPPWLPLFLLETGDMQGLSRGLFCQQDIASDGVFAVALLADFEQRLEAEGPWFYRALHWEAGALGQVLYLEAEALGLRGTGIGCYLDSEVHRVLGLWGQAWQCLYGFTVGRAVDDPRLVTLPAYFHRTS